MIANKEPHRYGGKTEWGSNGVVRSGLEPDTRWRATSRYIEVLRKGANQTPSVIRPTEVKLEARDKVGIGVPTVHEHFALDNHRIALSRPDVSSTLRGVHFG